MAINSLIAQFGQNTFSGVGAAIDSANQARQQQVRNAFAQRQQEQQDTEFAQGQEDRQTSIQQAHQKEHTLNVYAAAMAAKGQTPAQWAETSRGLAEDEADYNALIANGPEGTARVLGIHLGIPEDKSLTFEQQKELKGIGPKPATTPLTFDQQKELKQLGPPGSQQTPAATVIVDPTNANQRLAIDRSVYKGGGVGSPGVIGISDTPDIRRQLAAGSAAGKAEGVTRAAAPMAIIKGQQMLATIDKLDKHPGKHFLSGTGLYNPGRLTPGLNSAGGAQALLDQIGGQTFLEAYQTLRGGGQITEVEGEKATAALSRLAKPQSDDDFQTALDDLKGIVQNGIDRSKGLEVPDYGGSGIAPPETAEPTATPSSAEGTIIEDDQGVRMVKRNGKWVQM